MAQDHAQISNWREELLPNIIDHLAKVAPSTPYALYPNSPTTYDEGYRTVTYKDFANAVNGFAWWLSDNLGTSENFDVLAYFGPNDVRYTALLLGAVKAGYVAFFTSPRNSVAAHGALFDKLQCKILLTPEPAPPATEHIISAHPIKHLHVPSVTDLLEKEYPHYTYNKTYAAARTDPLVVVHTSGSTGIPKPLIWTHETAARHQNYCALEPPSGFQSIDKLHQGKRMLNTFPPFHAAGIAIHLVHSPPFGTVSIAPLSGALPTAESIVQALKTTKVDVAFLVPSIIADISQKPDLLDYCAENLELILYAGGDLPRAIGDKIAAKMPIQNNHGASEFGLIAQLRTPEMTRLDWHYVLPHPELGCVFEENSPGLYELVFKKDPKYEKHIMPFTIGPILKGQDEYRTRDLFVKHPTIADCWAWKARADDIIVFLNGEKTNPVSMEQSIISNNEDVVQALVFGMQRFQAGLLVEPAPKLGKLNDEEQTAFIDKIWPSIDRANQTAPAHARVEKAMIMLTSPERPMIRSGKGTIQRQSTLAMYADDIDDIYLKADTVLTGIDHASLDTKDSRQVAEWLKKVISQIEPALLEDEEKTFFEKGMDSLMGVRLVRALRHGLGQPELELSVVYNNPSLDLLTQYIVNGKAAETATNGATDETSKVNQEVSEIDSLLKEYEPLITQIGQQPRTTGERQGEVAVLTGSTGSLGIHLLQALLSNPAISHVYCLNRRANAEEIHETKTQGWESKLPQQSKRVTFLQATLHDLNLGLEEKTYETIRSTATLIIHNAWTVNFILPLKAFRSQFDGLTNLFRLAGSRSDPPKLLYISSISSVAQLPRVTSSLSIPEKVVRDSNAPYEIGYAKSKLVSELLCDAAAQTLDIPVSFARVGQIAGAVGEGVDATWSTAEWLPGLVVTSISLGLLPEDLGAELNQVDWVPVDLLSKVLLELGTGSSPKTSNNGAEVFNLLNPKTTSWKELIPAVVSGVEKHTGKVLGVVPAGDWLEKLQEVVDNFSGDDAADLVRKYPAVRLQEFYEARLLASEKAIKWDLDRATSHSATLNSMPAIGGDWVEKWVERWIRDMKAVDE
ncbi:NRPS-like enzyme [Karstenula rhodostoma CBS 690.94]|uniref:NRPS-like enzyme n=1 Tax=Karstenula rhodostoma CBS 690.94 TaxID=1392251 RepID=A0A9P4PP28_9PLEO|nr:NRPS-like enzyme [Karstenula rhodostoma CBS 690.94]